MTTRNNHGLLAAACLLLSCSPALGVQLEASSTGASLLDLSLEELMQVTVTTVSKKAQRLDETAAAVFVISSEDIRRSGASNVPEALRLAPGVQVAAMGHNKWSVSIRGFNNRFDNKLLVLVDGRAIYNPAFSGVFWEHNDIPMENIERIEVIRGPGGAIWGANAVNGVINIITYSAGDTQGGTLALAAGDELRGRGFVRHGWAWDEDTHLRLHAEAKSVDGGHAVAGGDGPDDWKTRQAGFRLDAVRGSDSLSLQGNVAAYRAGDLITAFKAAAPNVDMLPTDGKGRNAYLLGNWERKSGDRTHSFQAYLDHSDNDIGVFRYRIDTLDLEYRQRFVRHSHDVVWGLGYRHSSDHTYDTPYVTIADDDKSFSLYSLFVQDEITLVREHWRLILGSRFEHNGFTGFEAQPNLRLLWTPSEQDSLWAGLSRAVRTPSRGERDSIAFVSPPNPLQPFPLNTYALATLGTPGMGSETLDALDLGWRRKWDRDLTSDVSAFYYRHAGLRGALPPGGLLPYGLDFYLPMQLANVIDAESYGLEVALDWRPRPDWRLQFNTSLFEVNVLDAPTGVSTDEVLGVTPSLMASLRSSWDITPKLQWDVWLRHMGKLKGGTTGLDAVPAYTTVDMRLAWKPRKDLELSFVGQNLLDAAHLERVMTNIMSTPVEIERGFYLKAEWKF